MFFRVISAVMFSFAGGVAGVYFSERLKLNLSFCRNIHEMLMNTAVIIRCRADDVYTICAELKNQFAEFVFLQKVPDCYSPEDDFREIWTNAVKSQKNLPEDVRGLLCDFGAILGQSDIEGQLATIQALTENAVILEKKHTELYVRKGRLYRSVGILFGVMIGIFII